MVSALESVTCSLIRLPSHSGDAFTISSALARTRSTGVVKSTSISTVPIRLVDSRDQFWNGFSMK